MTDPINPEIPATHSQDTSPVKVINRSVIPDFAKGIPPQLPRNLHGGLLSDHTITEFVKSGKMKIEPFLENQVREVNGEKVISFGLTSYGYDIRCADEFKIFTNVNNEVIDPKNFSPKIFVDYKGPCCIIPPNSFVLARTVERIRIPRDVLVLAIGKSTYARTGMVVNCTPLEPEWEGEVTLEFSNTTNLPMKVYANEGCAQLLFFKGDRPCKISYADRGGKYQGQTGVVAPRT